MNHRDEISTQALRVLDTATETPSGMAIKSYDKESLRELVEGGYARNLEESDMMSAVNLTGKGIQAYDEAKPLKQLAS